MLVGACSANSASAFDRVKTDAEDALHPARLPCLGRIYRGDLMRSQH